MKYLLYYFFIACPFILACKTSEKPISTQSTCMLLAKSGSLDTTYARQFFAKFDTVYLGEKTRKDVVPKTGVTYRYVGVIAEGARSICGNGYPRAINVDIFGGKSIQELESILGIKIGNLSDLYSEDRLFLSIAAYRYRNKSAICCWAKFKIVDNIASDEVSYGTPIR